MGFATSARVFNGFWVGFRWACGGLFGFLGGFVWVLVSRCNPFSFSKSSCSCGPRRALEPDLDLGFKFGPRRALGPDRGRGPRTLLEPQDTSRAKAESFSTGLNSI